MESTQEFNSVVKYLPLDSANTQMTSSSASVTSSLVSPVDSGVQLLDSESDLESSSKESLPTLTSSITELSSINNIKSSTLLPNTIQTAVTKEQNELVKDDQIVFRRERKKKQSKSDTPKKRVSFHEDILNSTKFDDIHIDHGFVTRNPDNFMRFFSWDSNQKLDIARGRHSWAGESESECRSDNYIRYSIGSVDSNSSNADASQKLPKSSCLKKRPNTKYIDTQILQDDFDTKYKKSESNLLDSNLFGSLKNILSNSISGETHSRSVDKNDLILDVTKKVGNLNIEVSKKNQKLNNVILCDSNVYEHTGISYSYEYEKFQKSLECTKAQKPKNSTVYQMFLQDLNVFKKRENTETESQNSSKKSSSTDWSSDTETVSDFSEPSKHLCSPKRKVSKANHYSVQSFKPLDDAESKLEMESKFQNLKPATSKTSLISRFLRNVTMKKLLDAKLQKKQKTQNNKYMELYIKSVKPTDENGYNLDKELDEEIYREKKVKVSIEEKLGSVVMIKLKREIFRDSKEKLVNFYKVHSAYTEMGTTKPLVVFLTNATIYITALRPNQTLCNQFVLPYTELSTILIGPNANTIHFSNADREMQFLITTGCGEITNDLIGQLELVIRKSQKFPVLPAVRQLTMQEMAQLKNAVSTDTTVDKDEEYFYYSIVNMQDLSNEPPATPLGPIKKGPLMFKTANDIRWETGYFILKGGVLYIFSSPSNRLPLRALPLGAGACLGAHRIPSSLRPHTFELLLVDATALQMAAPDEYVASEWLQVLVQAASGLYSSSESNSTQACTLLLTTQHILTMRETFPCGNNDKTDFKSQTLSCAAISNLTAFRIPLAEQSWCILEFACREVHVTSGDLVVYFATNAELERFIATLEILWTYNNIKGDSLFPLSTIPENDPINLKCSDSYRVLQGAWSAVNLTIH